MSLVPVYLHEGSLPTQGLARHDLVKCAVQMIAALRSLSALVDEFVLGSNESIAMAKLSEDHQTLASLTSEIDRDWWRLFKSFDNRSPFTEVPHSIKPGADEEVEAAGVLSVGALWAHRNTTLVLSFPWTEQFKSAELAGVLRIIDGDELVESEIRLRQISTSATVESWKEFVENYGVQEAASSLIFEDGIVSLRMYMNDHDPPHVHVFLPGEPRRCRAKVRFDLVEFLKNSLPFDVARHVVEVVDSRRDELEAGWERCKSGRHPLRLGAGGS